MRRLICASIVALAALVPAVAHAQDAAVPPPTVTVGSVIGDFTSATSGQAAATATRTAAEKALVDAQAAEQKAIAATANQSDRLVRALKQSGPVVVQNPGGGVTVYELADDGTVRVLTPTPADQASVTIDAPAPAPAPQPQPQPAPVPDPAPASQAIRPRPAGSRVGPAAGALVIRINAGGVKIDGQPPRR